MRSLCLEGDIKKQRTRVYAFYGDGCAELIFYIGRVFAAMNLKFVVIDNSPEQSIFKLLDNSYDINYFEFRGIKFFRRCTGYIDNYKEYDIVLFNMGYAFDEAVDEIADMSYVYSDMQKISLLKLSEFVNSICGDVSIIYNGVCEDDVYGLVVLDCELGVIDDRIKDRFFLDYSLLDWKARLNAQRYCTVDFSTISKKLKNIIVTLCMQLSDCSEYQVRSVMRDAEVGRC